MSLIRLSINRSMILLSRSAKQIITGESLQMHHTMHSTSIQFLSCFNYLCEYIYIYICAGMQLLFNVTTLSRNTFPAFKDLNAKTRSSIPYKAAVQCQCPTSLPSATQVWLVWRRINVLYSNHTIFFPPSILLPGGMPKIAKHWQKCSRILQLMFSKQYTRSL